MSEELLLEELAPVLIGVIYVGGTDANDGGRQLADLVNDRPTAVLLMLAKIGALGVGGFENDVRRLALILLVRMMFNPLDTIYLDNAQREPMTPYDVMSEKDVTKIEKVWLDGLKSEEEPSLRSAMDTCLANWANECHKRKRFCVEVPPVLLQLTRSEKPLYRRTAYQVFRFAPILVKRSIRTGSLNSDDFANILRAGIRDPAYDPQLQAIWMLSAVILLDGVPVFGESELRTQLLREAFQVVSQTPDRDQLDQKLAALGEIAQKKPSALRDLLEDIWTYLLMLMAPPKQGSLSRRLTANPLSDLPFHEWRGLGQLASEMFIELAVAFPEEFQQPSRKHLLKDFVGSQIGAEISQLADHGDAHDWIVATEAVDDKEEDLYAEEALTSIGRVHSVALYEATLAHAGSLVSLADWRARYCSIAAIKCVLMGSLAIPEVVNDLSSLYNFTEPARKDEHPRVRYAWIHMIGKIFATSQGSLQKVHFLPILAACTSLFPDRCWRVREAAVRTLGQLFYKDDTTDFSFFDARNTIWVVEALYAIYPDSPEFVKLAIMITMARLARFTGAECGRIYRPWMEYLMSQAWTEDPNTSLKLRMHIASAALSLGFEADLSGSVVGKEVFAEDALRLAELLVACQKSMQGQDDLGPESSLKVWCALAQTLQGGFAKFLPHVMPDLLRIAGREPDRDEDGNDADGQDLPLSESMQEKLQAMQMIRSNVVAVGPAFGMGFWMPDIANVTAAAVRKTYPPDVRQSALRLWADLFYLATRIERFEGSTRVDSLYEYYFCAIMCAIDQEPPHDYPTLESFFVCVRRMLGYIEEPQPTVFWINYLQRLLSEILSLLGLMDIRQANRDEHVRLYGADFDQDEMERISKCDREEKTVMVLIREIIPRFDPFYTDQRLRLKLHQVSTGIYRKLNARRAVESGAQ